LNLGDLLFTLSNKCNLFFGTLFFGVLFFEGKCNVLIFLKTAFSYTKITI